MGIRTLWQNLLAMSRFALAERVITFLTRGLDVMMISFIVTDPQWGWMKSMLIVSPLYAVFCSTILVGNEYYSTTRNMDITGLETLSQTRLGKWMLQRQWTIFWFGSLVLLDPDYVSLLLHKRGQSVWRTVFTTTIPSVVYSMIFWTTVYWLIYQPFKETSWAKWIVANL